MMDTNQSLVIIYDEHTAKPYPMHVKECAACQGVCCIPKSLCCMPKSLCCMPMSVLHAKEFVMHAKKC